MAETKAKQSDMFKNLMTTLMALRSSADEAITTLAGIKDKTAETYTDLDSAAQTAVEGVGEPIDQFQQIMAQAYPEEGGEDEDIELDIVRPDGSDEQLAVEIVPATTADEGDTDDVGEEEIEDEDDAMHTVESEQVVEEEEEEEDIVEINTTHLESCGMKKKKMLDVQPVSDVDEDDEMFNEDADEEVHADFEKDPKTGQFTSTGGGAGTHAREALPKNQKLVKSKLGRMEVKASLGKNPKAAGSGKRYPRYKQLNRVELAWNEGGKEARKLFSPEGMEASAFENKVAKAAAGKQSVKEELYYNTI